MGISRQSLHTIINFTIFIPVTRRVIGYTRLVGKYVTGRWKRLRPHKVYKVYILFLFYKVYILNQNH